MWPLTLELGIMGYVSYCGGEIHLGRQGAKLPPAPLPLCRITPRGYTSAITSWLALPEQVKKRYFSGQTLSCYILKLLRKS